MNPSDPGLPANEKVTEPSPVQGEVTPTEQIPELVTTTEPTPEAPTKMEETEAVPEDEKKVESPEATTPPENPVADLREQIIAMVPDEAKSQVAALLRSLLEYAGPQPAAEQAAPAAEEQKDSPVVRKRYEHLPFRPRVTREETASDSEPYGSLAGDPEPE